MKSESIKSLAKALGQAQVEIKGVPLDARNDFIGSKYATLGAVIEAIRPVLTKYGLSYSQLVTGDGDRMGIDTLIMHESGEWLESSVTMPVIDDKDSRKSKAQVAGSIVSYLRRYALAAAFGLYTEEDTDGNTGQRQQRPQRPAKQQPGQQPGEGQANGAEGQKGNGQTNGNKVEIDVQALVEKLLTAAADASLSHEKAVGTATPAGNRMGTLSDEQLLQLITTTDAKITTNMKMAGALVYKTRQANKVKVK